ncbi:MAG: zinc ribbon domain-containing protein [Candidatus Acidiferrales bacterium]
MAGFCRNCGSPLDDGQGFCARCGTAASGPPMRPSAPASPASSAAPPAARPQAAPVAAPAKSGSTLLKVLLGFVIVIFVLGAAGVAGIWYVGHRIKQKVHDMGLDNISAETSEHRGPALGGVNPCSLLSKADVAQAVKMDVVRAEQPEEGQASCEYSVMGDYVDLIAKHASLLRKAETNDAQRQMMESFAKSIGHGTDSDQSNPRHPGESPVFIFSVDNTSAVAQMSLSRATLGQLGPGATTIPALGDDAFDIGNAMMMVRKGDKVVHIMYMMCPCTTDDVVPLAKRIVGSM